MIAASGKSRTITAITLALAVGQTADTSGAPPLAALQLDADLAGRAVHARAVETFHRLQPRTRDVYRGFAEGVNHYIRLHADEFPPWVTPDFTPIDALARDVQTWSRADAARFVARLRRGEAERDVDGAGPGNSGSGRDAATPEGPSSSFALDGSNAWAFHGSRTESGNTILLRNPHLRWDGDHDLLARPSGLTYYEAHVRVPGVIDFYGEFRRGEQLLRMMMAQDLDEWLDVMKMRAHPTSNFTYAGRDGNIAHYYNVRLPLLPHPVTGDTAAFASGAQHLSVDDVIELKHNPRMLMAERVMDDLLGAAMAVDDRDVREAAEVLSAWDLTAAADSRGGVLFERWANQYFDGTADSLRWRQPWDPARAHTTPYGVSDSDAAVEALRIAALALRNEGITPDAPWGDVHRVTRGDVDEPVSGCPPTLGCFRALSFEPTDDGRLAANRGDSWVFVVEFGDVPKARTVLAYGQTARPGAPHYADQAAMFAAGKMKEVAWTDEDIRRKSIMVYRPGEEVRR